jgi:methylglutaconyl-CoA hydratase
MYEFILMSEANGIATITLNRPDKRNAMHGLLVKEFLNALNKLITSDSRILIINGNGESFCAGGDIAWMQKIAKSSESENNEDAQLLADMLYQLYSFPKPTIVLAHGATLGGGLGLLAAADIAIAAKNTTFGLPEVKIGITPSMISPYIISAIGERAAHYYFLTGNRFDVNEAYRLGLIHQVTEDNELMYVALALAKSILQSSPQALSEAKKLIRSVAKEKISENLAQKTAEHLANIRASEEAQEGLRAFVEKREAKWV